MKRNYLRTLLVILVAFTLVSCAGTAADEGATPAAPTDEAATNLVTAEENEEAVAAAETGEQVAPTPTAVAAEEVPVGGTTASVLSEETLINLYERVNPSVVNIQVQVDPEELSPEGEGTPPELPDIPGLPDLPEGHPFTPTPQQGVGSGFVYDKEGHIITNNHVVANASEIIVTFADETVAPATVVGTDPDSDLAVIKVEADPELLVPVAFSDSDALRVGQFVVAIGNPYALSGSMTTGIISGLGRTLPVGTPMAGGGRFSIPNIIQTDAAINPGNSGGPLLDLEGEVIGMNTAIESPVRGFAGIGYAVPANTVAQFVPDLIADGRVEHPWIGISGVSLNAELAEAMELDADQRGVMIGRVVEGSPAEESELQGSDTVAEIDGFEVNVGGDIIVGIDDQPVEEFEDLLPYLFEETDVGQTVTLHILRGGEQIEVPLTLASRPAGDQ